MPDKIAVSEKDLQDLKVLYNKTDPGKTFIFKGHEILREYAKYMIEYLETKWNKK